MFFFSVSNIRLKHGMVTIEKDENVLGTRKCSDGTTSCIRSAAAPPIAIGRVIAIAIAVAIAIVVLVIRDCPVGLFSPWIIAVTATGGVPFTHCIDNVL